MVNNSDWDEQLECFLGFNFSVDWQVDNMDGHSLNFNTFVHSEEDALFPAPVGIVLDFDLSEDNSARIAFEQVRLSDDQSSL